MIPVDGTDYPVKAGDVVIVEAGEDHHTTSPVDYRLLLIIALVMVCLLLCLFVARHFLLDRLYRKPTEIAQSGQQYVGAVYAFKAQHGSYPSSLQELVPGFLAETPTNDSFAGWVYAAYDQQQDFYLCKLVGMLHMRVEYHSSELASENIPAGWSVTCEGTFAAKLNVEQSTSTN